jgi:hypothetical protein
MPDMQSSMPSPAAMPPGLEATLPASFDEFDYALGCECANPALQIESWASEARGSTEAN